MAKVEEPKIRPLVPVSALASFDLLGGSFQGEVQKGPADLPGAHVGDVVHYLAVVVEGEPGKEAADSFEPVITVADQIEQLADADLGASVFEVLLLRKKEAAPALKLDGTEKLKPVPFDAHEQVVRGTHTHSFAEGYRAVPQVGEYVPQEFPKSITVGEGDDAHVVIARDAEHESQLKSSPAETKPPIPAGRTQERRVALGPRRIKALAVATNRRGEITDRRGRFAQSTETAGVPASGKGK